MSLTIDPPACTVPAAGGKSTHALNNGTAAKIIIKVKCSNNTEYRMNPVYSFVDAGAKIDLEVTRLAGPAKEDKAVIQYGPAPADATDPQAGFPSIPPDQVHTDESFCEEPALVVLSSCALFHLYSVAPQ
ncbi:MSP domain protein [Oesophagostomum dentatum]|uniref:Major sperm protein n=1 Tax=Oesophagostomum dentatum TaxID=61180 RepID=A0A0B1SY80_OESDE|nr:MSP domain protein [Oesophagostomum dentatum]